jgi:hypothetical protein
MSNSRANAPGNLLTFSFKGDVAITITTGTQLLKFLSQILLWYVSRGHCIYRMPFPELGVIHWFGQRPCRDLHDLRQGLPGSSKDVST